MKRILAIFLLPPLAFAYSANDGAKTIASDGSQSDTQAAFDYADAKNQDGWEITIGTAGGSYTWTTTVAMASTFVHSVRIRSAGGWANKTTLTGNFSTGGSALELIVTSGKYTEISGFIFKAAAGAGFGTGWVNFDTNAVGDVHNGFRIHHCRFEDAGGDSGSKGPMLGIVWPNRWSSGFIDGLVDQNYFYTANSNTLTNDMVYCYAGTTGTGALDLGQWAGSMTWGTNQTIRIENNDFDVASGNTVEGNPAIDSAYYGVRRLIRYNRFHNTVIVAHGADSAPSSTLQDEILHNTFTYDTNDAIDFIYYHRGGSCRFGLNTINFSNGASANQIVKTAIDHHGSRSLGFQQIGHGASSGTEVVEPDYVWGNTINGGSPTVVGAPNNPNAALEDITGMYVLNTHYFLSAPGGFSEIAYPDSLNTDVGSPGIAGGKAKIGGKATFK